MLHTMVLPLLLSIISLPFFIVAVSTAVWLVFAVRRDAESRRWPRTPGRVVESWVVDNRAVNGLPGWHWKIRYAYRIPETVPIPAVLDDSGEFDINPNSPDAADPTDQTEQEVADRDVERTEASRFRYRTRLAASRLIARYPPGSNVEVAFSPTDPQFSSTIRPGFRSDVIYPAAIAMISFVITLALAWGAFASLRV